LDDEESRRSMLSFDRLYLIGLQGWQFDPLSI
jgi:hypothetical protein